MHSLITLIIRSFVELKINALGYQYFGPLDNIFRNSLFPTICKFPVKMRP